MQFLDRLGHARRCATTGWMVQTVQKTGEVPHVQYFDRVVDVPAAVHRQGLDVPVSSRRCLRFSSSAELDYDGSEGVFWPFWPFFALLRVVPE